MIKRLLFSALVFLFFYSCIYAQELVTVQDIESWHSLGLEKKILDKRLSFSLGQEFRLDENSSHINNYFTNFQVDYKLLKTLKTGVGYRFIRNNKNSGFVNERRLNFDISFRHKIDRVKLGYRFRVQNRKIISGNTGEDIYPISKYRFRIKGSYNIKNWKADPYFSGEMFYSKETITINFIETITEKNDISGFEKLRLKTGIKYPIKKIGVLGIFYGIEKEFSTYLNTYSMPATTYLIGLNLNFKL
jgi:hypothetical protein